MVNRTAEAESKPDLHLQGPSANPGPLRGWPGTRERRKWWLILVLFTALSALAAATILIGTYAISIQDVYRIVATHMTAGDVSALDRLFNTVIWEIRIPRILLVILVGCALAASGAVYQGAFRNPLVEPFILGVSAGASLGAALSIVYPRIFFNAQLGAFVFALIAVILAYLSSRTDGRTPVVTLVLAGVIVSTLFQALVSIMKYLADDQALRAIVFWTMGGFYYAAWGDVRTLAPPILVCFLAVWLLGWRLNVLSMGDEEARAMGVDPDLFKLVLIVLATLMTAVAVSAVGIIAWVGLMMPHAVRMLFGPDNRFVIPGSALLAGIFLLICDTLARTLTTAEIPVSIITSILGAPFLFHLLRTKGRFIYGA
jgi:iron complex transport system permease protein